MMKNLFLFLFLFLSGLSFGQKYLRLIPEIAPDSAGCNGKAKAIYYGGVAPYQMTWWDNHWQPSNGVTAENLCDKGQYTVTFTDSTCRRLESLIKMRSDTTKQIYLDTVIIVMPSAPGMCDGEMYFQFQNITGAHNISMNAEHSSFNGTGYSFTGLCEDVYHYHIYLGGQAEFEVAIDNRINPPTPCYHYDESVIVNQPTTSTSCNGTFQLGATSTQPGANFGYAVYIQDGGGATNINPSYYNSFITGICEGPYLIDYQEDYSLLIKRKTIYVFADGLVDSTWNVPDSIIPGTDTILLQALVNCAPNYSQGVDTAYISSITALGNSQYEFGVTIIQGTDTINAYASAITDTSHNFFIDITLFCEDSSRTMDPFLGKRNLIYHGVKLSTNKIDELENFKSIKIFPNPFESNYTLEFDLKKEEQIIFELTDISGKIISSRIYSGSNGKNRLDFDSPGLSNGLYLLRIISENGQSVSKKVIKN